ncbi:MAG: TRAP transporter small permease [Christensenellales bacterium]|jgi:C4-dicarboxylate transporter DctQ subunit
MRKAWEWFQKLSRVLERIEGHFITIFTLVMGAIILIDVALRNLGMQGFAWVEEFGRFMLVTTTIMGCSIAAKHNGHMVMDAVFNLLPARWAYYVKSLAYALSSVLYLYLSYYSYNWMIKQQLMKKTMQSIQFPAWIMWLFVTYGVLSMGIRYFNQTIKCLNLAIKGDSEFSEMNIKEN